MGGPRGSQSVWVEIRRQLMAALGGKRTLRGLRSEALGYSNAVGPRIAGLANDQAGAARLAGQALMPAYAMNLLPGSVVGRPLEGEAPTIDLVIGYHKSNQSSALKLFLSRSHELVTPKSGKPIA